MHPMASGRRCYNGSRAINWQYHSSVAALPLVPMIFVAIQQLTRDICQYMIYKNNIWLRRGECMTVRVHVYNYVCGPAGSM